MKPADFPTSPIFSDVGMTFEEDGFIQFDPIEEVKVFVVDDENVNECPYPISSVQRVEGATGVLITFLDDSYLEVLDGEDVKLRVYELMTVY